MLSCLQKNDLRGGILYHDGQFDDARRAIALLRTFPDRTFPFLGGIAINHMEAIQLLERQGKTIGVQARDRESGAVFDLQAKIVINACGVQANETIALDGRAPPSLLAVSQGSHFRHAPNGPP